MSRSADLDRLRQHEGRIEALWELARPVLGEGSFADRKLAVASLTGHPDAGRLFPLIWRALDALPEANLRAGITDILTQIGARHLPELLAAAEGADPARLRLLAEVFGAIRSPVLAPRLIGMLQHDDSNVRFAAIEALGRIGTPAALDALVHALDRARGSGERFVLIEALSLGWSRLPPGQEPPVVKLAPLRHDPILTRPLLRLLCAVPGPRVEALLWSWLPELSPLQLQEAAKALGAGPPEQLAERTARLGKPTLQLDTAGLRSMLGARDPELRAGAIWFALWSGQTGELLDPLRKAALPAAHLRAMADVSAPEQLQPLLRDLRSARGEQLELLIELAGRAGARNEGDTLLGLAESHPELRALTFRWSAALGRAEGLRWLPQLLGDSGGIELVADGLAALYPDHRREILAILRPWSESLDASDEWRSFLFLVERLDLSELRGRVELAWKRADPELRARALALLARFRLEFARHYLAMALSDDAEAVRLAASDVLLEIATPTVRDEVLAMLDDRSAWIRAQALRTLLRIDGNSAVPLILRHLEDEATVVRIEALRALRTLQRSDLSDRVRPLLTIEDIDTRCEVLRFFQVTESPARPDDLRWFEHPHWRVRLEAALWLAAHSDTRSGLLNRLETEEDADVRQIRSRILETRA